MGVLASGCPEPMAIMSRCEIYPQGVPNSKFAPENNLLEKKTKTYWKPSFFEGYIRFRESLDEFWTMKCPFGGLVPIVHG